jgi:hypothetical protein
MVEGREVGCVEGVEGRTEQPKKVSFKLRKAFSCLSNLENNIYLIKITNILLLHTLSYIIEYTTKKDKQNITVHHIKTVMY